MWKFTDAKTIFSEKPPLFYSIQIQYTNDLINKKIFFPFVVWWLLLAKKIPLGKDISFCVLHSLSFSLTHSMYIPCTVYIVHRLDRCHIVIDTYWLVNFVIQYWRFQYILLSVRRFCKRMTNMNKRLLCIKTGNEITMCVYTMGWGRIVQRVELDSVECSTYRKSNNDHSVAFRDNNATFAEILLLYERNVHFSMK